MHFYLSPGKRKGAKIAHLFRQGFGAKIVTADNELHPGPAAFYGTTSYTLPLLRKCIQMKKEWYYVDNAYYFGRGDYYRVTKNRYMTDGLGDYPIDRLTGFRIKIENWKKNIDGHILITTQSDLFHKFMGQGDQLIWARSIKKELAKYTDRDVRICAKPVKRPSNTPNHPNFEDMLKGAFALVTHSSSTAVGAIIKGIPVFTTGESMADHMGKKSLSEIESPLYPSRSDVVQWLANLSYNQWTYEEIRGGVCRRMINGV
jgi:hypothetical protein